MIKESIKEGKLLLGIIQEMIALLHKAGDQSAFTNLDFHHVAQSRLQDLRKGSTIAFATGVDGCHQSRSVHLLALAFHFG